VILTPHMGEAKRLLDSENPQSQTNVLTDLGATLVLKDAVTTISNNEFQGQLDYGHPGMAKAGSGDVLAGIITSLLGQKYSLLEAAKYGVYLHQIAGCIAVNKCGEHSLMASDIIESIGEAISKG